MTSLLLNRSCGLVFLATIWCLDSSALAVHPGRWVHTNEADFAPGKNKDTVVTNLGDVKLATGTRVVAQLHEQASIIYDMQVAEGGEVYLAAGPETKLLRRWGDKAQVVVSLSGEQVFALDSDSKGKLLVGVSGGTSRLAVLEGDKLRTLVKLAGVRYIWDVVVIGERVYLATGTEGRLLEVDLSRLEPVAEEEEAATKPGADGSAAATGPARAAIRPETASRSQEGDGDEAPVWPVGVRQLVDARQANLLCLGRDEKDRLFFGTDTDGLIYRVALDGDRVKETFVLFDAPEPEIGALLVLADGTVYAGTADAEQARPGRLTEAAASESGRPADETKREENPPIEEPKEPGEIPHVPPKPQPSNQSDDGSTQTPDVQRSNGEEAPIGGPAEEEPRGTPVKPGGEQGGGSWDRGEAVGTLNWASGRVSKEDNQKNILDRIRRAIQERAEAAGAGKKEAMGLDQKPSSGQRGRQGARGVKPGGPPGGPPAVSRQGNALYKIDVNGFVTEVFRESVMIVRLGRDPSGDGKVLVATGNEGLLYSVDPGAEETVILADLEPQQVPAILTMADGQVFLGTANPAEIVELDRGYAHSGAYTSPVLDAAQIGLWGKLNLTATIPNQTTVSVETRSGNVEDPDHAAWSGWSRAGALGHDDVGQPLSPIEVTVGSPPARFLQYRLSFDGDGKATGVVGRVELAYVVPNLKPAIQSIKAAYPTLGNGAGPRAGGPPGVRAAMPVQAAANNDEIPEPPAVLNIEWEVVDANNDRMKYKLEYQPAGSTQWLPLAEDLDTSGYEWQVKRVPDGRYLVRVEATDSPDNTADMAKRASRVSDPVLIDNAPPRINDLHVGADAGVVSLSGRVEDNLSPIQRVDYAVDSTKEWQPVLPEDLIYDSTKESVATTISGLKFGAHVVTIRAIDGLGNASYKAVQVEVR